MARNAKRVDDAYTANDVGQWGDARELSYGEPFEVAGETVDLGNLPRFGSSDEANVGAKAPLLPPGSP